MVIGTQGISSSRSGKEAESTPSAETTHPHKSVLEPFFLPLEYLPASEQIVFNQPLDLGRV